MVEVQLLVIKELKLAYDGMENGDEGDAQRHYDRASGLMQSLGIDLDNVEDLL